jgi:hypothetical protein
LGKLLRAGQQQQQQQQQPDALAVGYVRMWQAFGRLWCQVFGTGAPVYTFSVQGN